MTSPMKLEVVARMLPKHATHCAQYDPDCGPCDCGAVSTPLVRLSDAEAANEGTARGGRDSQAVRLGHPSCMVPRPRMGTEPPDSPTCNARSSTEGADMIDLNKIEAAANAATPDCDPNVTRALVRAVRAAQRRRMAERCNVTHVVYPEGSPGPADEARLWLKHHEQAHASNPRWTTLEACQAANIIRDLLAAHADGVPDPKGGV